MAYQHAEPEVRRQLVQAAFDKLWVVGAEATDIVTYYRRDGNLGLAEADVELQPKRMFGSA